MRARPWLRLLPLAFAISGCSVAHVATEPGELLGSYSITVDPTASGDAMVVVARLAPGDDQAEPIDAGVEKAAPESVLTRVSVVGPGTWDAATKRLRATVRVTNVSAPAMDEPYIVVRSVTKPSSCVVFEGTHGGGGYVGAQYRFADITAPGPTAVNGASAKQLMVIYDPCGTPFNFTIDVRSVVRGSRRIVPDRDDDRFNIEPGQVAGDDCDDTNANVYPGGPIPCACGLSCNSCGTGCCEESCRGGCARTCVPGCVCDVHPGAGSWGSLDCRAGSTCNLDCADATLGCDLSCSNATCTSYCEATARRRDCASTCSNGAECTQQCFGAGDDCRIHSCTGGSDCTLACTDTRDDCVLDDRCGSGSTCDVVCDQTGGDCQIAECDQRATCQLACNGTTGDDCRIGLCTGQSTCDVTCSGEVRDVCGIDECRGGATCHVSCLDSPTGRCTLDCSSSARCVLDCGSYTGRACDLSCGSGRPRKCGGSNVWVCPNTPCP